MDYRIKGLFALYYYILYAFVLAYKHLFKTIIDVFNKNRYKFSVYRLRLFVISPIFVRLYFKLFSEVKDGDWLWYINHTDIIPNDHVFTYIIINISNFFVKNAQLNLYIVEYVGYCLLFLFMFLALVECSRFYINNGDKFIVLTSMIITFICSYAFCIYDGTALKFIWGMAFFNLFLYIIFKKRCYETKRFIYTKYISLSIVFIIVILTHVVPSLLLVLFLLFYAYRNVLTCEIAKYKDIGAFMLACIIFIFISFSDVFGNSNAKILSMDMLSIHLLVDNFIFINTTPFIIYEIILIVFIIVSYKKGLIDYFDVYLCVCVFFILYCSVPYTVYTLQRFMGIIPFISSFQLIKIARKIV